MSDCYTLCYVFSNLCLGNSRGLEEITLKCNKTVTNEVKT